MIERKAFLQITKALILGLRNALTDPSACIKQNIIEELAQILGVERCVVFRVGSEDIDGRIKDCCEIVAGVPLEEYGPELRQKADLEAHPDLQAAVGNGRMVLIRNPCNDERTAYFRGIVERKDIGEIVYIPLFIEEAGEAVGVIVIDATHGRKFSEDELLFCSEVAELLSLLLGQESIMLQHLRDAIINKVVPLGGYARRLRENLQATLAYIDIIHKEATEISSILPQKLNRRL